MPEETDAENRATELECQIKYWEIIEKAQLEAIIMWFLRIAKGLSEGLIIPVEGSLFLLSPHIPDYVILLSEAFFATQGRFLRPELSRDTTIAGKYGQAVIDLKLEVKWELVFHGMGSNTRSGDFKEVERIAKEKQKASSWSK